jgi:hypothetical protein
MRMEGVVVPTTSDSAGHWRKRAEEVRSLAENANDAETKQEMLQVAHAYDEIAESAGLRNEIYEALGKSLELGPPSFSARNPTSPVRTAGST